MNNKSNIKGIEMVWLSETDLTNLNSGEGGSNFIDVKKYSKDGVEYPYVSGQAMRHYLREAIRRSLEKGEFMCTPNDAGENCGDPVNCINCDLFGYMLPKKNKGSSVRVSPLKMSPAMGLLPFEPNSTIDYLTRKKVKETGQTTGGDIVNVELGVNLYKCGLSIDVVRVSAEEEVDEQSKTVNIMPFFPNNKEKNKRICKAVRAVEFLTDYSKQSRLLTNFTPDLILAALQDKYSHRLQKAFVLDNNKKVDVERFEAIINDVKDYSKIYFGITPNIVNNEKALREKAKELGLDVLSPKKVLARICSEFENSVSE